MTYSAITTWQAGIYHSIDTMVDGFPTIASAAKFAGWDAAGLRIAPSNDRLLFKNKSTGEVLEVLQDHVFLEKQKEDTIGKPVISADDFEPVEIPIQEYGNIPDEIGRTFESLAYGVQDEKGNRVRLKTNLKCGEVFNDEDNNKYLITSLGGGNFFLETYNCIIKRPFSEYLEYINDVHPSIASASSVADQETELEMFLKLLETSELEHAQTDAMFVTDCLSKYLKNQSVSIGKERQNNA